MAAGKQGTGEMSRQPEPCSVCLDVVQETGDRSIAKLKCGHHFHLDCIGSAFNAKGAMQCPNCRHVEDGHWLYANGNRWSDDLFNEEVSFADDDHDYFHPHIPDFPGGHGHDREEAPWNTLQSIWCPYQYVPPQSAGSNHPPYLSSLGDSEGTTPFFSALLDTLLNNEDTGSGLHGRPFCPHTGHGLRHPRQVSEDSQTRPAGHVPDSRDSSMGDGATVTERWSSTERGLYGWGRRGSVSPGQGGTSSLPAYVDMQHNGVPAMATPDIDLHSGRMDASIPSHHQTHAPAWSSLVNERQVGFLPYHLWEVYENVRLRRGRGPELTRLPGNSASSYARVLRNILGSNSPHSHQRTVDAGSSPATSHGIDSSSNSSSSSTHGTISSSHGNVLSPSNDRAPWSYNLPRPERCDTPDAHSGNSSHPEFYFARQSGPSQSQPETSASFSVAAAGATSFSSSAHAMHSSGIRRVRTGFVTRPTRGQAVFGPTDQNRRMTNPCPWLHSAAASQEPPPVIGMEGQAVPPWRREPNSTVPSSAPNMLQAEVRVVMRSVPSSNGQAATGTNSQSNSFRSSAAPLTPFLSEGQGGSPRELRGDPSRVPLVGRWGALHSVSSQNNFTSAEAGPPTPLFRPVR